MKRIPAREGFVRLRESFHQSIYGVRHHVRRHRLESRLADLVQAANGHEARGLQSGSPEFRILFDRTQQLVADYCNNSKTSAEQLMAELPVLGKLRQLAQPAIQVPRAAKSVLVTLAAMLLAFLLGVAGAVMRFGYHLLGGGR